MDPVISAVLHEYDLNKWSGTSSQVSPAHMTVSAGKNENGKGSME
jgi:hypothetical protein